MSPWYDRDDEESEPEISAAWYREHGTLRVPPEHIRQAWQRGLTGLEPDRRTVARQQAMAKAGKNPQTRGWWPAWKAWKPSGGAAAAAWRPAPRNLAAVLSCRYTRTVARDNTVHLGPRWVQLPRRRSYAGRRVELREGVDGRLLVFTDGACVATQPAPAADFILRPRRSPSSDRRPRRRASESPGADVGRYLPISPKRPSSPRPRLASPARTPHPSHPWRHSTPYSPRPRG